MRRFHDKWGPEHTRGYKQNGTVRKPQGGKTRQTVTLCLIVKNEEKNLADCIGPVKHLFDAVHVTDTGSTDRTREIARELGVELFEFPWCDHFGAARNASMSHVKTDWILWLDADDRVEGENIPKLAQLLAGLTDENVCYGLKCRCLAAGGEGPPTVVDHIRLFRNHPAIRWTHRVHEQILPAIKAAGGQVRFSPVTITHVGYMDPGLRRRKTERDLKLLRLELEEMGEHPFTLFNLGSTLLQELGDPAAALPLLQKSLDRSEIGASIVRKLFALIARCHTRLNNPQQALETFQKGRQHYPDDGELLLGEGLLRLEQDDGVGAEDCFRRLLGTRQAAHFASVLDGLYTFQAHHHLGLVLQRQGRLLEAENCWRLALQANPHFLLSWRCLANLYAEMQRWQDLWQTVAELERLGEGAAHLMGLRRLMPAGWRPTLGV